MIAGIVIAVVGFPLIWFLVKRHRPEYYGLVQDGITKKKEIDVNQITSKVGEYARAAGEVELTLGQTLKTRTFWLMMISGWVSALAASIMTVHLVPFLTDMGMSTVKAAGVMSVWLTCAIPSRLAIGFLVDRMGKRYLRFVLGATYILQAIGVTVFLLNKSMPMLYLWFVIYGLGQGANFSALIPLLPRYFGRKSYGSIDGLRSALLTPIALVGPIYVGWVYDTTRSYTNVLILFAITLAIAGVVASFMVPPKAPLKVSAANSNDNSSK
jgi:cyanate permease